MAQALESISIGSPSQYLIPVALLNPPSQFSIHPHRMRQPPNGLRKTVVVAICRPPTTSHVIVVILGTLQLFRNLFPNHPYCRGLAAVAGTFRRAVRGS